MIQKVILVIHILISSFILSSFLNIQSCKGEAYGAAYLITKEHLIYQPTDANLTWVNCEMGSFIMMNGRASPQKNINGSIVQTLDIFDFSMVHLSWFERLQGRYKLRKSDPIKIVNATTDILRMKALLSHEHALPPASPDLNRTIVIMPWLGSEHGAGHSKISNRLAYLRSCFWSLYEEYPNIAVMVKNEKDQQILRNFTEMPFYDVVWIPNLPKSASLPVATVQQAKVRLMDGRWDFDFVFFTESDQVSINSYFSI